MPKPDSAAASSAADDSQQLPQFLASLYDLITDPTTDHIVTWKRVEAERNVWHFVVFDTEAFTAQVLPKYYRTHKMTSFMRQLNNYGFSKVKTNDPNDKTYEFEHESNMLRPDRLDLLQRIERRRTAKRGAAASSARRAGGGGDGAAAAQASKRARHGAALFSVSTTTGDRAPTALRRAPSQRASANDASGSYSSAMPPLSASLTYGSANANAGAFAAAGGASAAHLGFDGHAGQDDESDYESGAGAGAGDGEHGRRRPRRHAAAAARNAIKAVAADDEPALQRALPGARGGAGADDDSSESPTSETALSRTALQERRRQQIDRLRHHHEPLSLADGGVDVPDAPLKRSSSDALKKSSDDNLSLPGSSGGAGAAVPSLRRSSSQLAPSPSFQSLMAAWASANNNGNSNPGAALLGKSGEMWNDSSLQKSSDGTAPLSMSRSNTPSLPRVNSVTDFFGAKREVAENKASADSQFFDSGLLADDGRGLLKSSTGGRD